jgi:hypothetical protein
VPHFNSSVLGIFRFIEKWRGEARINNKVFADLFSPNAIYRQMPESQGEAGFWQGISTAGKIRQA